jgi:predicted ArsR family transcriptional regulator
MATEKAKKKTRTELAIEMMKRKTGATAAQMAERFNIKEHSVRALISKIDGVSTSKPAGGSTVYRVEERGRADAAE